jgi:hypothetical protein
MPVLGPRPFFRYPADDPPEAHACHVIGSRKLDESELSPGKAFFGSILLCRADYGVMSRNKQMEKPLG